MSIFDTYMTSNVIDGKWLAKYNINIQKENKGQNMICGGI